MSLPRVLSYPPVHDAVNRLHGHACRLVHRDQPSPVHPALWDPDWLRMHRGDWDVAHLQLGFEHHTIDELAAVLDAHQEAGTPLVWTAHDLRNPATRIASRDAAVMRLLAERVDRVITLTPGAADELRWRTGRIAEVVPHGPLVLDLDPAALGTGGEDDAEPAPPAPAARPEATPGSLRALLLARDIRPNTDWRTPLRVFEDLAREGADVELEVWVHEDAPLASVLTHRSGPGVVVRAGSRLPLPALCSRIRAADVLLLPYVWGTHSGLLELATDLGTPSVVGDVGHITEQGPCLPVRVVDQRLDGSSLRTVLLALLDGHRPELPDPVERAAVLGTVREAHRRIYAELADLDEDVATATTSSAGLATAGS
ncbi:MAG: hypothetical protein ACLGIR_04230 [Actinomycetes bacterium]